MPAPAHVQRATIDAFLDGWDKWTPEAFLATWSEDCTQKTLPYSHNVPIRDRANTNHLFPILMSIMDNFQLKTHNIVHDAAENKAAVYCSTTADTPFGPYTNEHAIFLWFNEAGDKIVKIEEMFDQFTMKDFAPQLEKYAQFIDKKNARASKA
uniref:Dcr3 n=1 Tax=Diaporthe longicolla TaxID=54899 RepID=A0A915Q9E4_9PEZI